MKRPLVLVASILTTFLTFAGGLDASNPLPDGLTVEFLRSASPFEVTDAIPEFGWLVHSPERNDFQTAYHILVASDLEKLEENQGDMWDSTRIESRISQNVSYDGKALQSNQSYYWKVKTWCHFFGESTWSEPMAFSTGNLNTPYLTNRYQLEETPVTPDSIRKLGEDHYLIDFGKVAFGFLHLKLDAPESSQLEIHFGEKGSNQGIDRNPGGSIRYYKVMEALRKGKQTLEVHPPRDDRNTGKQAIQMPPEIGVVAPFRYIELVNCPVELEESMIHQVAVHYPFDETASSFQSSDPVLNDIWDLCKYSMKATSFCGVYVDGDRERIPYEADAYINQLSHYAVDRDYSLARYSHEYLLKHPTWPTEWKQHSILMAWTDFMYTGNIESLSESYELLKSEKTLEAHAREDGLLNTKGLRDIVDWPIGERDGYVFTEVNTVVNAFYYKTLLQMADIAAALGKNSDAAMYQEKSKRVKSAFNKVFFDELLGTYVDGEGVEHASLHASMMPLAFGLVPEDRKETVTRFVVSRGMACSVYGAQYLLEALYAGGRADVALARMTSKNTRSWYNMLRVGSTITLEAWDNRFKPNQDWNHAWGAVPGNIIPRYLLGVRPLEPGFRKVLIQPQPASLKTASAKVPTILGPLSIAFENSPGESFKLTLDIPVNMTARIGIPQVDNNSRSLILNGKQIEAELRDGYLFLEGIGSGPQELISE